MAPTPEAMPAATATHASRSDRLSRRARRDPIPAAIWPLGPACPSRAPRADGEGRRQELDDDGPQPDAPRVLGERRDGPVDRVRLDLGGDPADEQGAEERAQSDHERKRPRPRRADRTGDRTLPHGRRHLVAGQHRQEDVGAGEDRLVEGQGAQPPERTDRHAEDDPLLDVGGRRQVRCGSPGAGTGPARRHEPGSGESPGPPRQRWNSSSAGSMPRRSSIRPTVWLTISSMVTGRW